jgi:membrane protein
MAPTARTDDQRSGDGDGRAARNRARRQVSAARARYEGTWAQDLIRQLKVVHFLDWTSVFGAELLWSALPFIIVLSSLANTRIDDDLSRHLGLNNRGAHIVETLFRNHPTHAVVPIVTGLLFSVAGILAVVASLQVVYERLFDQEHRGWRDLPRYVVWVAVVLGLLVAEGIVNAPERRATGPMVQALMTFVVATIFFAWTMYFLLAGRVRWRRLVRPALVTAVLWLGLALFSSLYFSSLVIDDSRDYGKIGVIFTFLTWFILIGGVIVIGGAVGAVWEARGGRGALGPDSTGRRSPTEQGGRGGPAPRRSSP